MKTKPEYLVGTHRFIYILFSIFTCCFLEIYFFFIRHRLNENTTSHEKELLFRVNSSRLMILFQIIIYLVYLIQLWIYVYFKDKAKTTMRAQTGSFLLFHFTLQHKFKLYERKSGQYIKKYQFMAQNDYSNQHQNSGKI